MKERTIELILERNDGSLFHGWLRQIRKCMPESQVDDFIKSQGDVRVVSRQAIWAWGAKPW